MKKASASSGKMTKASSVSSSRVASRQLMRPASFVDLVERYKHSVVSLEVSQPLGGRRFTQNPFAPSPSVRETAINIGTGFVFDKRGYLLTNEHVVHGATDIQIRLYGEKKLLPAELVAHSYELDLAVLKADLPFRKYAILPFGNASEVKVGEWVIAIGCPLVTIQPHKMISHA